MRRNRKTERGCAFCGVRLQIVPRTCNFKYTIFKERRSEMHATAVHLVHALRLAVKTNRIGFQPIHFEFYLRHATSRETRASRPASTSYPAARLPALRRPRAPRRSWRGGRLLLVCGESRRR